MMQVDIIILLYFEMECSSEAYDLQQSRDSQLM